MTPEEQAAETARLEKEQADADFEAEIVDLSDEEKEAKRAEREASNPDNQTDYRAIAQQERERREKAEKALAEKRFQDAERKRKTGDDEDEDDDDKPITRKDLHKVISETAEQTKKSLLGGRIKDIVSTLAESEDEAEAIIELHANRPFPSYLTLEEQLEEAHAIVNRKKLVSKNAELKRALKSKDTASKDSAGTHRDTPQVRPRVAPDVEASLKAQKFEYDNTSKLWKKKLPNGRTLCKDTRVKPIKTFTI